MNEHREQQQAYTMPRRLRYLSKVVGSVCAVSAVILETTAMAEYTLGHQEQAAQLAVQGIVPTGMAAALLLWIGLSPRTDPSTPQQ